MKTPRLAALPVAAALLVAVLCRPPPLSANECADLLGAAAAAAPDCDGNGVPDACEIEPVNAVLAPGPVVEAPRGIQHVDAGDFDGDGDLDAVVFAIAGSTVAEGSATVFFNDGAGRLTGGTETSPYGGPTGTRRHAAVADLDGDGRVDVATVSSVEGAVRILAAPGTDSFRAIEIELEAILHHVLAGDVDADGDTDLVVLTEQTGRAYLVQNQGDLSFTVAGELAVGREIYSPAVMGDIDRDGDADLIATARDPWRVLVLASRGDGTFAPSVEVPAAGYLLALLAVDADLDGDLDLVASTSWPRGISIHRNDGAGVFEPLVSAPLPVSFSLIAAADFDLDGDLDLGLGAPRGGCVFTQGTFAVLHGIGPGVFARQPVIFDGGGSFERTVVGDFDGDGRPDVAGAGGFADPRTRGATVLLNHLGRISPDCNGNGVPDRCDAVDRDCNWNGIPDECDIGSGASEDVDGDGVPDECPSAAPAGDPVGRPPEDCDGDGVADAEAIAAGTVDDCNANGRPDACDLVPEFRFALSPASVQGAATGLGELTAEDLDGDGALDLVVAARSECCESPPRPGLLRVLLGDGATGLVGAGEYRTPGTPGPVVVADLDGDGARDLLVGSRSAACDGGGSVSVYVSSGAGDGRFAGPRTFATGVDPVAAAAGDLDGDGDADVVVLDGNWPMAVRVYLNDGVGGVAAAGARAVPGVSEPAGRLLLVDLDGDGDLDVAGSSASDETPIWTLVNDGGAVFSGPSPVSSPQVLPFLAGAADLDLDGDPDLVLYRESAGFDHAEIAVLPNDGRGGFPAAEVFDFPTDPLAFVIEDADGDGDPDLSLLGRAIPFFSERPLIFASTLRNRGDGSFEAPTHRAAAVEPISWAPGDFDGDGLLDWAVTYWQANGVAFVLGSREGTTIVGPMETGDYPIGPAAGDLDADGFPELVVANAFEKDVRVFSTTGSGHSLAGMIAVGGAPRSLAVGDLDGDGREDIAAAVPFAVVILFSAADGVRHAKVEAGSSPIDVVLADLDGDGSLDMATANELENVSVFLNEGGGRFAPPRNRGVDHVTAVEAADIDLDRDIDLLAVSAAERGLVVLENDGRGTFVATAVLDVDGGHAVIPVDADGDLDVDLVALTFGEGTKLLRNQGDGTFGAAEVVTDRRPAVRAGAAADLDQDGAAELILERYDPPQILRSQGGRFVDPAAPPPAGDLDGGGASGDPEFQKVDVVVEDLDADGDLDIAWIDFDNLRLQFFYNDTPPASSDVDRDGILDECDPDAGVHFLRGDANVDGALDVSDAVRVLNGLFGRGRIFLCPDAADANDDGRLNISDPVGVLRHLFLGALALPAPAEACGTDPTEDGLECFVSPRCD